MQFFTFSNNFFLNSKISTLRRLEPNGLEIMVILKETFVRKSAIIPLYFQQVFELECSNKVLHSQKVLGLCRNVAIKLALTLPSRKSIYSFSLSVAGAFKIQTKHVHEDYFFPEMQFVMHNIWFYFIDHI